MKSVAALSIFVVLGCSERGDVLGPASLRRDGATAEQAQDIAIGVNHACAISDGRLLCWGQNDRGQLGTGDQADAPLPRLTDVAGLRWKSVATGREHSCALDELGRVHCWGGNDHGQLGQGDLSARSAPSLVALPEPAKSVATKFNHTCAVLVNAGLYCWGQNSEGQLGQADAPPTSETTPWDAMIPMAIGEAEWRDVDTGEGHSCGIHLDGSLWCWGRNSEHELGSDPRIQVREPLLESAADSWLEVGTGQNYTCALRSDSTLWCWGQNTGSATADGYPLGIAGVTQLDRPTRVGVAADWVTIRVNTFHSCAVNRSSELWCWGRNVEGQLGLDDLVGREMPTLVGSDIWTASSGRFATCALTTAGHAQCTGMNEAGQLGTGDFVRRRRLAAVLIESP